MRSRDRRMVANCKGLPSRSIPGSEGWTLFALFTPFLLGEAGSEIDFASVLPVSPGIGAECFLLEQQKNQSSCRKTKSSFLLPLSCPSALWGQEERMLLEAWT